MEFGKLEDISGVNWELPQNNPHNYEAQPTEEPKLYFGAPAWTSKFWVDKIYPKEASADRYLHLYSQNFNCIELNTTHYRIPSYEIAQNWLGQVNAGFRFCPKVPQSISHDKVGMADEVQLKAWFDFLETIEANLGPCFIQFHENFSYADKVHLLKFLERWPKKFRLSIELRHPSWYEQNAILPALGEYLQRKGIGLVITDVAGKREILHSTLTTNWSLIRLIGNNLVESDKIRLRSWSERILEWQSQGQDETYLIFHQPDDVWTIEFAQMAEEIFYETGFNDVPHLESITPMDLFQQDWRN